MTKEIKKRFWQNAKHAIIAAGCTLSILLLTTEANAYSSRCPGSNAALGCADCHSGVSPKKSNGSCPSAIPTPSPAPAPNPRPNTNPNPMPNPAPSPATGGTSSGGSSARHEVDDDDDDDDDGERSRSRSQKRHSGDSHKRSRRHRDD